MSDLPMAPDIAYLWRSLEPALNARGLLGGDLGLPDGQRAPRRDIAESLAFAVAMERRAEARLADLTSTRDRASAEAMRVRFRRMARVMAFMLGLLPAERVKVAPVDARGHDPEISEWFGLDPDAFAAATREALTMAEAECGRLWDPDEE